jgi:hypothetical protein
LDQLAVDISSIFHILPKKIGFVLPVFSAFSERNAVFPENLFSPQPQNKIKGLSRSDGFYFAEF